MNNTEIKEIKMTSPDFVTLAGRLKAYGITRFIVDAQSATTTYFNHEQSLVEDGSFNFQIAPHIDVETFIINLKAHQKGEIDFSQWLAKTTQAGIASWEVSLSQKTCTYFDNEHNVLYVEAIPLSE